MKIFGDIHIPVYFMSVEGLIILINICGFIIVIFGQIHKNMHFVNCSPVPVKLSEKNASLVNRTTCTILLKTRRDHSHKAFN